MKETIERRVSEESLGRRDWARGERSKGPR